MASSNNAATFLTLTEENRGIIFKVCNIYCKDKQHQQDLEQEIIYQLWRSYPQFNPQFKFTTWMYRVALNVAISFYRKNKHSNDIISISTDHEEVEDNTSDHLQKEQNIQLLYRFIDGLQELDKALMLLYLEEKSYSEIAEVLGISETNVATKISRIKQKLKQHSTTLK
ncbi:RNA polymerase sigma factor [Ferruginibacter sp.]